VGADLCLTLGTTNVVGRAGGGCGLEGVVGKFWK